jgi:hypothetical protein
MKNCASCTSIAGKITVQVDADATRDNFGSANVLFIMGDKTLGGAKIPVGKQVELKVPCIRKSRLYCWAVELLGSDKVISC